ncbi:expressed unknown protein [Seminavis robusta]|uniref:Hemerythrin-like domain-containing protein n=1 Tax=Seminavis robusta TaxID=568900 RepID=A0A9N8H6H6_9STRA|nr:expressed unknown protein [Seminavis robusta]|eukprot:Sro147_g067800.1 n/a (300) ;mRNA; f:43355-44254
MVASVVSTESTNSTASKSSSGGGGAPKPMPMAVMRNAHEVIRGAMDDIQESIDNGDFEAARAAWTQFNRFSDLHMKMEEGRKGSNAKGLFAMVDEHADKAARKAGLRDHHMNLYELEEDVVDIFDKAPDIDRAREVYPIFRQENESHLKEEEDVLMPAIQKMIKSGVPVKKYIETDIIPLLLAKEGDMEFFIKFSNEVLIRHDNVDGKPRVRVWNHALWSVATPEQWKEWDAWIKEVLPEGKYAEVDNAIQAFRNEQKAKKQAKKDAEAAKEVPPIANIDVGGRSRSRSPKQFFKKIFS